MKDNKTTTTTTCLRPGCDQPAKIRGLCKKDHSRAHRLVKQNKTTWAELEATGKILPTKSGFGEVSADAKAALAWFTSGKAPAPASPKVDDVPPAVTPEKAPKGKSKGKGPTLVTPKPTTDLPAAGGLLSQLASTEKAGIPGVDMTKPTSIPGVTRVMVD